MALIQQQPQNGVMSREPALTASGEVMLCTLLINALVSSGLPITSDWKILIISVVGVLGPAVSGVFTRLHVFSPATVAALQKGWSQMVESAVQDKSVPPKT